MKLNLRALGWLMVLPLLSGCAATTGTQAAEPVDHGSWVANYGGLLHDARHQRIVTLLAELVPNEMAGRRIQAHVLNCGQVAAFSWPDGSIYVARGLADALTDDELRAALAHELGHLLNDGRITGVMALRGNPSLDIEAAADASGCRLLAARGKPVAAMRSMLGKVMRAPSSDPACRKALAVRIARLEKDGGFTTEAQRS
jgi:predicted Zn-dependent protease